MFNQVLQCIEEIKKHRPLVLNLTNFVTMQWVANGLLSLGASPIMTNSIHEIDDLVRIAQSIVINIGTLDAPFMKRAKRACKVAEEQQKPLILDPVGAGASAYRTQSCLSLLEQHKFTVIRGNAGEIMALAGQTSRTKGVDSIAGSEDAIESARYLSSIWKTTVAISGKTDVIVTNQAIQTIDRGDAVMTHVTGTGCLLTAVVAAFNAICDTPHQATVNALLYYAIAGELAAQKASEPGSFQVHFLDSLSKLPVKQHYE